MTARKQRRGFRVWMESFSQRVTASAGSTQAFMGALLLILCWLALGPLFHFSDTWQLVINTFTTIVTFLMVFLIQRAQNKEGRAVALKLSELIAAVEGASNRLIDVEDLSETELARLHERYAHLAKEALKDASPFGTHSVEEEKEDRKSQGEEKGAGRRKAKSSP